MAGYRPSKRRHRVESDVELKLIPVMSLLVVLVPMLLQTAVFDQLAAVQLNLPSVDDVAFQPQPPKDQKNDSVTVAVTSQGFRVISSEETIATVALTAAGRFDFKALAAKLTDIKGQKRFAKQEAIILLVDDSVLYEDVIDAMDVCRPIYPGVSLAPAFQAPEGEGEGG